MSWCEFEETEEGFAATLPLSSMIGIGSDAPAITFADLRFGDGTDWYTFDE